MSIGTVGLMLLHCHCAAAAGIATVASGALLATGTVAAFCCVPLLVVAAVPVVAAGGSQVVEQGL